jgi:riboflavin kinase / FMN adenylyltransferase
VTLVVDDLCRLSPEPRALAIGTFDGVHIGHRAVIAATVAAARARQLTATVLTFERHPLSMVRPSDEPRVLTPFALKVELISELDVDEIVVLPFDRSIAELDPDSFCRSVLSESLSARVVVVGRNFTFGAGASGSAADLCACGRRYGFETEVVRLARSSGRPISSTRIRRLLHDGRLEEAREILGRPPRTVGRVVRGFQRGRHLGFPTANIEAETGTMFPGRGVYAARARVRGVWYRAAVNVGHNPTFVHHGDEAGIVHVEAYLLGFDGDIYGEQVRLDFLGRIRAETAFEYVDDLVARMRLDIEETAAYDDPAFSEVGL